MSQPIIKIKPEHPNFVLPEKKFRASCYDVVATKIEIQNSKAICYLGFSTEIEPGWKGIIVPRSSQTKTNWAMLNSPGQVDEDYRGEWQVRYRFVGHDFEDKTFPFKEGDRVAQIYFEKVQDVTFKIDNNLSITDRGAGGYGSTGK